MGLKVKHRTAAGRPCSVCQSPLLLLQLPSEARCRLHFLRTESQQRRATRAGGLQNVDATRRRVMRLLNFMPMVRLMHALSQTQPVFGSALIFFPGCG